VTIDTHIFPATLEAPIVACETRILSVPLDPIIITANYRIVTVEMVLLRLKDADGVTGHGCLWCFGVPQATVVASVLEYLAPRAHGAAARDIGRVTADLRREINFFGFKGLSVFGLSAIDMAMHDVLCRRLGVSLSSLLGRRRDDLPIYWSGLFLNQSTPELVDETERVMSAGVRALKFRVGKPSLQEDIDRLQAVLGHVEAGTVLMLDAVQEWTPEEAIRGSNRLAEFDPLWLEDPLVHCDYPGLCRVVERSPIPIATGENEYLREGFLQLIDAGCQYFLADMQRVGGIREWLAVASLARIHSRVLTPHVYPHVALQLCAALEQAEVWIEHIPWWDDLMTYRLDIADGHVKVPDAPGIGFDFDPEVLDARALGPWQDVSGT
jgi:L-alanine-DL-glutamate epimerase-like enolase superfamily enzyme